MPKSAQKNAPYGKAVRNQNGQVVVRDSKTGQFVTVKGAGALKGSEFTIKEGIDLTKPIASQALREKSRAPKRSNAA